MLGYRVAALDRDPLAAPYLLHVILGPAGRVLGRIGCHAAPDAAGEVEIGYFVEPGARGHGVAGRAVDAFLCWLCGRGVRRVRATVSPDNTPSLAILRRRGFVEVGTQWDDEDGTDLVFQLVLPDRAGRTPGDTG
jgi:[ribosomal protein S5]-alanine N-acetyltransferase